MLLQVLFEVFSKDKAQVQDHKNQKRAHKMNLPITNTHLDPFT